MALKISPSAIIGVGSSGLEIINQVQSIAQEIATLFDAISRPNPAREIAAQAEVTEEVRR